MLTARILSTGSEILQGLYADTNAQQISRMLFSAGFRVVGHSAVPDNFALIKEAMTDALKRCDLVVMTGGLGPTEDDLNRDVVAEIFRLSLSRNEQCVEMIRDRFLNRGVPMPEGNLIQAMLPEGCVPLYNHWGTAPGFVLAGRNGLAALVALPGPPGEWRPMFEKALAKEVAELFPLRPIRAVHTLHIALTPESVINDAMKDLFAPADDIELTILAGRGIIRLRIAATGTDVATLQARTAVLRDRIVERLGPEIIFAEGGENTSPAEALLEVLKERRETLALAESCTGGWIGKSITDIAGSSEVLKAGYITYGNGAKVRDLGVSEKLLEEFGAVSEEVVRAMAEGARRTSGATHAIAVSGVAGPGGGSEEKPVGTIWFGVATPEGTFAHRRNFRGSRDFIRELSVTQGLELLRRHILGIDPELYLGGPEPRRMG